MSVLLVVIILFLVVAAAGVALWLLWCSFRDAAVVHRALDVVMVQVLLPRDLTPVEERESTVDKTREQIAVAEQFLSTLSHLPTSWWDRLVYGEPIIVFEVVAHQGLITFYAGTERRFIEHLERQIYALYPEADVRVAPEYTLFDTGDTVRSGYVRLRTAPHLPMATYRELEADPLQALTGALSKLQQRDAAVVQLVCRSARGSSRKRGRRAATRVVRGRQSDVGRAGTLQEIRTVVGKSSKQRERSQQEGQHLTPRMQQRVELVEQKAAQPHFNVNVRFAVAARDSYDAQSIFDGVAAVFSQYDLQDLNTLAVHRTGRSPVFVRDLIWRVPRQRTSSVLSTGELASLFHFPLPTTDTPTLLWRGAKAAPVPPGLPTEGILLGHNVYRGLTTPIHFGDSDRRRHLYMIGQTGTGKTTLFLNMIVQDIHAGRGVGVVDPHGDLIEDILLHIPPERHKDVILFDPRDTERPLGFNILETRDPAQQDLVVNEVVQILQKLAARLNPESVGPMFEHYLRNALLALSEDDGATLIDVPRMFVDQEFRHGVLQHVSDPTVRQFWDREFAQSQRGQMSADMLSYVISKMGRFIGNRVMRNIIGQAHSSFDVRAVMDEGKILLCNLSKGLLGDINSDLLGFVLVSKLQVAALGRADVAESQRRDFSLYLDEFQNFTTDSIVTILSEARKYGLALHLTHQFIQQLDDEIREAVFGNVGTVVSFRVGVDDAEVLAQQFEPVFSEYDVLNLERYTACVRLLSGGTPQRPFSLQTLPSPEIGDAAGRDAVRQLSREQYGRVRDVVEERILERFQFGSGKPASDTSSSGGSSDYLSESLFDIG